MSASPVSDDKLSARRRSARKDPSKAPTSRAGDATPNSASASATPCKRYARAKRVRFYRNGDQFFKGVWYALAFDRFRTFDSLLEDLNRVLADLVNLPHGVRFVFSIDGQRRMESLSDFDDGQSYVCSSNECFKRIDYANVREPVWSYGFSAATATNAAAATAFNGDGTAATTSAQWPLEPNDFVYPRIVTILRNGIKPRRLIRHLLNKRTARSFEQVLSDLSSAVRLDSGAVKKLYTLNGKMVCCLADLFKEDEVFLACGSERVSVDDLYLDSGECQFIMPSARLPRVSNNAASSKMSASRRAHLSRLNEKFLNGRKYENRSVEKSKQPKGTAVAASSNDGRRAPASLPSEIKERFDWVQLLGDGNFAVVHQCKHRETGRTYAVKVIDRRKCRSREEIIDNEVRLLSRVCHENVVRLHDSIALKDFHLLVLEYVPGGDLFDALVAAGSFDEPCAAQMMNNLLSAIGYLHDAAVVHRDVKPENLLIYDQPDGSKHLKLADFGLAIEMNETPLFDVCGTPTYVAPEMLAESGYGFKVDVWAAGVILYIMLCGYPPFVSETGDQEDLFVAILSGKYSFAQNYWSGISNAAKMLVTGMLHLNADDRYTASEALSHPWIQTGANVDPDFEHVSSLAIQCVDIVEQDKRKEENGLEPFYQRRGSMDELSCLGGRDVSSASFF